MKTNFKPFSSEKDDELKGLIYDSLSLSLSLREALVVLDGFLVQEVDSRMEEMTNEEKMIAYKELTENKNND